MVGYLAADWWGRAVITFLGFLNKGIYVLVKSACLLIVNLSEVTFNDDLLGNFQTRIYIVLAIFMLFKLAFSLMNSIVNPDNLADKEKGMHKIISRTIIALIMLIMFPTIFNYAMDWQKDIVAFIPRVIIGRTGVDDNDSIGDIADSLAATALSAFITVNKDCETAGTSGDIIDASDIDAALDATTETCEGSKKVFKYEFSGFVSLIAGIVLVFILISYSIDIAVRVLKLGVLKILSPIPIISYIDPKSQKSGAFANWLKECISTYTELFIKMGILYFALFILGNLTNDNVSIFNFPSNFLPFTKVALIIGTFFFMGKAADFICDILGIKKPQGSGGFLKGLAAIGAAAGIGASVISSARTNYKGALASQAARGVKQNKGAAIASAILGGGAGLVTAGRAVAGAKSGKFGAALSATNKRNAAYTTAAAAGSTFGGKASSYIQRAFTGETEADKIEREIKELEDNSKNIGSIVSRADDKAKTSKDTVGFSQIKDSSNRVVKQISGNYQQWTAAFNAAKTQGLQSFNFNGTDVTMEEAEKLDFGLLKSNSECYIKNHGFGDTEFQDMLVDYEKNNPGKSVNASTTRKDMKDAIEALNVSKSQKSRDLKAAKANADATKPK